MFTNFPKSAPPGPLNVQEVQCEHLYVLWRGLELLIDVFSQRVQAQLIGTKNTPIYYYHHFHGQTPKSSTVKCL